MENENQIYLDWNEITSIKDALAILLGESLSSLEYNNATLDQLDNPRLRRLNQGIKDDINLFVCRAEEVYNKHKHKEGKTSDVDELALWHDCSYNYSVIGLEAANTIQSGIANLNAKIRRELEKQQTTGNNHGKQ